MAAESPTRTCAVAGPAATRGHGAPRSATAKWGEKWGRGEHRRRRGFAISDDFVACARWRDSFARPPSCLEIARGSMGSCRGHILLFTKKGTLNMKRALVLCGIVA